VFEWKKTKIYLALSDPTTAAELVRNTFINTLVMANSIECLSRDSTGHASIENKTIGRHFVRNKARTTSSEAARPILL
jgi:hypothetical protein